MALGRGLESLIPPIRKEEEPSRETREELKDDLFYKKKVHEANSPEEVGEEYSLNIGTPEEASVQATPEPSQIVTPPPTPTPTSPQPIVEEAAREESTGQAVFQIEVDKVVPNPHQPRRYFDENALRDLSQSIREFGVLQPLVVSKIEMESEQGLSVHYELIAGERRLLASRLAGLKTVPAIIREVSQDKEKLELAVIENIQRENLNPIELARSIARLQDEFGLTQREIGTRLGKSRGVIANSIRLLSLPTEMQEAIASGKMSEGQARILLSLDDSAAQQRIFQDILRDGLSVRDIDERVKHIKKSGASGERNETYDNPEIHALKTDLEEMLGTKVDLQSKGSGGGKITISYYSPEELEAIVDKMLAKRSDDLSL